MFTFGTNSLTEHEWVASTTPNLLLAYLRPWRRYRRQLGLYVCAWYRQCWKLLNDPCRDLISQSEQYAYGIVSTRELAAAKREVTKRAKKEWDETGRDGLAEVGPRLLKQLRLDHLPGWEGMPPLQTWFVGTEEQRRANEKASSELRYLQVVLLRDVFGNPFRPVRVDFSRITDSVRGLARAAYDDRRLPEGVLSLDRLVTLADAVEAIRCADVDLIGHLRSPGPHVCGCWAVDLLVRDE